MGFQNKMTDVFLLKRGWWERWRLLTIYLPIYAQLYKALSAPARRFWNQDSDLSPGVKKDVSE